MTTPRPDQLYTNIIKLVRVQEAGKRSTRVNAAEAMKNVPMSHPSG